MGVLVADQLGRGERPGPPRAGKKAARQPVSRLLGLSQRAQVGAKVVGRGEGVGVASPQRPAAAGQGVLGAYRTSIDKMLSMRRLSL
jgi:hypothetical protein